LTNWTTTDFAMIAPILEDTGWSSESSSRPCKTKEFGNGQD